MAIHIEHDGSFDIALGRSRKETSWKNKEMLWSDLLKKLQETRRTHETYNEYIASKKPRQDELKDIGGFVGGYLNGGRRKSGNVLHRQLITLDLDFANVDFWDDYTLFFGNAACVYSTHKHSVEHARYRLIIPLDRTVFPDEYEAIARRIAGNLNIELFDPTTFQPERLMYWPSTSQDGQYVFEYQDGAWLSADEILASYHDWKDTSEWPVSDKVDKLIKRNMAKQGDPLEKPGVIGAFCRTYTVEEAIDLFLTDVYIPCDVEGRYTYKEGSTSAGLVVYEDKYAYSHHGTDPVSGKLCNAFDLVRLHKYGLKDEDMREGTPGNKLPSYVEMLTFATKDPKVRKLLGSERLQDAHSDFEGWEEDTEPIEGNDEWLAQLDVDRKGNYYSTINNVAIILENDPRLKGCFATDAFRRKKMVLRHTPWRKVTPETKYLKDEDEQSLVKYLEKWYGINSRANIQDAFDIHIDANSFHPIREYLSAVQWDGKKRVENIFIDYVGAADTDYVKTVTRKTMVAAVARIFEPGIKFDYVLTIVGEEGLKKSSLIGKLGKEWFSDSFSFNMLHSKEAYEQIQGVWLVEIAELAGLKKADIEGAKQFISKKEDSFRVAYGRNVSTFKRQCVFFGSTNNIDFLRGQAGNRRFWPVTTMAQAPTKQVFKDLTDLEINQVWAEAVELYKAGETLYLDKEMEQVAKGIQEEHTEQDDRTGLILKYLDTKVPANWYDMSIYEQRAFLQGDELQEQGINVRKRVCVAEIWCELMGGSIKDMTTQNTKYIHDIMRKIDGWKPYKSRTIFKNYGNQFAYYRDTISEKFKALNTTTSKN